MVRVKVSESQLKKKVFYCYLSKNLPSVNSRLQKSPTEVTLYSYYTKHKYYCLDRVIFALYLYAEVTAFLYEGCAILRKFVALYNENFS